MSKVYIDPTTRCSCGHVMSLHSVETPNPCRSGKCGCEGFLVLKKDGTIITTTKEVNT